MDRRTDTAAAAGDGLAAPVAVTFGAAAADVRRTVGPAAWCALEVLATTPSEDGEAWIVLSSVRDVAARIGVATNTAQRALALLRDAGLVATVQGRGDTGRFGRSAYRLTVDADVLNRSQCESRTARNHSARICQPTSRPASKLAVEPVEQLALLPSA